MQERYSGRRKLFFPAKEKTVPVEQSLQERCCMKDSKLSPEVRFSILMLIVAILLILSIMNKWI